MLTSTMTARFHAIPESVSALRTLISPLSCVNNERQLSLLASPQPWPVSACLFLLRRTTAAGPYIAAGSQLPSPLSASTCFLLAVCPCVPQPLDDAERMLSLQMALKCADLGHMAAELSVHVKWVRRGIIRVMEVVSGCACNRGWCCALWYRAHYTCVHRQEKHHVGAGHQP